MKRFKYIVLGVIMASILASVLGCEAIDKYSVNEIEAGLKKKYGGDFTVTALGDRFDRSTITAYAYANDDESLMFTVTANGAGEIVTDCYAYRTVCRQAELITVQAFEEEKMTSACIADFIDCSSATNADVSIEEFVRENDPHTLKITIVTEKCEGLSGRALENAFTEICHKLPDITVVFSVFVLSKEEAEIVIPKVWTEVYLFGRSRLKQLGAGSSITELYVEVSGGVLSKSAEEMELKLKEGSNK